MKYFYNSNLKIDFINHLIIKKKTYYGIYNKLFFITAKFEDSLGKDLSSFESDELLLIYKSIAKTVKYTTIATYNSLIGDYKVWCKKENVPNAINEICNTNQFKNLECKQYSILNDEDIERFTGSMAQIDGADYNAVIFMRLLWEIDAREKPEDILAIKIDNLDIENSTIKICDTIYHISNYLTSLIKTFAEMDYLIFANRNGKYAILPATKNAGYILRPAYTKNAKVGEAFKVPRMSGLMYKYSERNEESININDILMSLALKYMLIHKKTHAEMYTERRYFANLPSSVYQSVFLTYAKEKFPDLYKKYVEYFKELKERFQI